MGLLEELITEIYSLYVHHAEKEQGFILLIDLIMGKKNKVRFFYAFCLVAMKHQRILLLHRMTKDIHKE